MVNDKESKFTGTSGTIAWELEEENVHLIVMWSVPYNLRIYNSYFGVGVVQLSTRSVYVDYIYNISIIYLQYLQVHPRHAALLVQADDREHPGQIFPEREAGGEPGVQAREVLHHRTLRPRLPSSHKHQVDSTNLETRLQPNYIRGSVMPWQTKDLSPSIWHKLYVDSLRTTAAAFNR